jgi:hypothetical protein
VVHSTAVLVTRFSNCVADDDASACAFAEFSPKWRAAFSHLRGGSYNRTVVHDSPRRGTDPARRDLHRVLVTEPGELPAIIRTQLARTCADS